MPKKIIICDRCGIKIEGFVQEFDPDGFITAGFYDLTDSYWKQFALENERYICDECMFKDLRYQNR